MARAHTAVHVSMAGCTTALHPAMGQRMAGPLGSRVRCAGMRPPLTPTARHSTSRITHSKFKRGSKSKCLCCRAVHRWPHLEQIDIERDPLRPVASDPETNLGGLHHEKSMGRQGQLHLDLGSQLSPVDHCSQSDFPPHTRTNSHPPQPQSDHWRYTSPASGCNTGSSCSVARSPNHNTAPGSAD